MYNLTQEIGPQIPCSVSVLQSLDVEGALFQGGETDEFLDKTVSVPTVNSLTLAEWMAEFERLKKVNAEIMGGKSGKPSPKRKQTMISR